MSAAIDPLQALSYSVFSELMGQLKAMAPIMVRYV
jgi:hypothetical protein